MGYGKQSVWAVGRWKLVNRSLPLEINENVSHVILRLVVITALYYMVSNLGGTENCGVWDGINQRTVGRWKYDESKCTHKD